MRSFTLACLLSFVATVSTAEDALLTRLKIDLVLPDPSIRFNAMESLASNAGNLTNVSSAVPLVMPLLRDADPAVRMEAAVTLAKIGASSPQLLKQLRAAANDPDSYVREKVLIALVANGMANPDVVTTIAAGLDKLDEARSSRILDAIAARERRSDDADFAELTESVVRLARTRCCGDRSSALGAVAALAPKKREKSSTEGDTDDVLTGDGNPAVATLLTGSLREKRNDVVAAATTAAAKWYSEISAPDEVYAALIDLTLSPQNDLRSFAIDTLGKIVGNDDTDRALITALNDRDHTNRLLAAQGLAKRPSNAAVSALVAAVDDPSVAVRAAVATTLQSYGTEAAIAAPAVARLLRDPSDVVRAASCAALAELKSTDFQVTVAVVKASTDSHPDVRAAAVKAIGAIMGAGTDGTDIETLLVTAAQARLDDEIVNIRRDMADGIATTAPRLKTAIPLLRQMAKSDDVNIQMKALTGLAKLGREAAPAIPELITLIGSDDVDVRAGAAKTLARTRHVPASAIAPLITSLAADHNCGVVFAIDALSYADGDIQQAFPAIVGTLASRDYYCTEEYDRLVRALAHMPEGIDAQLLEEVRDYPDEDPRRGLLDFGESRKKRVTSLVDVVRRERAPVKLMLLKPDGSPVSVDIRPDEVYIAVATWCPYSRKLREELLRPEIASMLPKSKIHFVLAPEWASVRSHLIQAAQEDHRQMNDAEADAAVEQLKKRANGGPFFDPAFVVGLPGDWYLLPPSYQQKELRFPSIYSRAKGEFYGSVNTALDTNLGFPEELIASDRKSLF